MGYVKKIRKNRRTNRRKYQKQLQHRINTHARSFLVSTGEVSEGHYEFRPWTEAYTMWIPTGATLDSVFYEKREKHWERFLYAWLEKDENISYGVYGLFEDRPDSEEYGLIHLADYAQYEGDFERFEEGGNIYYYGKRISQVGVGEEGEKNPCIFTYRIRKAKREWEVSRYFTQT